MEAHDDVKEGHTVILMGAISTLKEPARSSVDVGCRYCNFTGAMATLNEPARSYRLPKMNKTTRHLSPQLF
jgi:hypothetical protein